jgi:hypothetical protein
LGNSVSSLYLTNALLQNNGYKGLFGNNGGGLYGGNTSDGSYVTFDPGLGR